MEIIHIILGKANPNRMNGVNKVVYQMATEQVNQGEKIAVWGITKDMEKNYGERNFETRLFLKSRNPFGLSSELKKAIVDKKSNTIFHIHGGWIPRYYTIARFLHKNKIPYVFTPHGAYNAIAMNKSFWLKKWYFTYFEKEVLQKASKIHCLGKSETIGLKTIFQNTKTVLVPYGFEIKEKIAVTNKNKEELVYGFIGRLDIYTKGLDKMISAFDLFTKAHPNTRLWIIGDGEGKEKLNKMIVDRGLTNHVLLFGSKFGKHKETLLDNIDVFIHPSRNEGLPTSVIEAASYGKPCLVSYATNLGELIYKYNAGKMVYTITNERLLKAMEELYQTWEKPEEFTIMRLNAIRMVKENYNWKKIIEDYNTHLYQVS